MSTQRHRFRMDGHTGLWAATCAASLSAGVARADFTGFDVDVLNDCATGTTYAVYATFDDPNDELVSVIDARIDSTTDFIDFEPFCLPFLSVPIPCDSYVTIGLDTALGNATDISPFCEEYGCFTSDCGFECTWFNDAPANGQGQAGPDGRTLIAMIVVPDDANGNPGMVTGEVQSIQYLDAGVNLATVPGGTFGAGSPFPCLLVLLDRTGSMNIVKPATMDTICNEAFFHANQEILVYSLTEPTGLVSVWTFAGANPTDVTGGFVTPAAALAALAPLNTCSGATPLAESICTGVDEILCTCPEEDSRLLIITDGAENNSSGECDGPPSVAGPPPSGNYDAGSWHDKVYLKVKASGIETSTWLWDPDPFPQGGAAGETVPDQVFFDDLSEAAGGYFIYIPFDEAPPPSTGACCFTDGSCQESLTVFDCQDAGGVFAGLASTCAQCEQPCLGDTNGDNVVNVDDLVNVILDWDTNGAINGGDVDSSGLVDVDDIVAVIVNWGPCP